HLRMVQLSGNATLALIAGMLHEIFERHTSNVVHDSAFNDAETAQQRYKLFVRSLRRLIKLLRERDGEAAFIHWGKHMKAAQAMTLAGNETTEVRDILD
ncbi:GntR family transcriptional regulator, partial [Rhodococcus sp. NPDC003318]